MRREIRYTRGGAALALAAILGLGASAGASALTAEGNLPATFGVGVGGSEAYDIDRIKQFGLSYRYFYLTGGLGANDWSKWNSPDGEFARIFLRTSRDNGMVPVFTYYELVQVQWEEPPWTTLQDPASMNLFWNNWKLLMTIAGERQEPVIVHVEPDLWGYMAARYFNNAVAPGGIPVSVAGAGVSELADPQRFPNNAAGWAKALIHLRDTYAPNVILAWHASHWGTGFDIYQNKGMPEAEPEVAARKMADWFALFGVEFDMVFADPLDRDSGYYQEVRQLDTWWLIDNANRANDDFRRYERYMAELTGRTGTRGMLWQIPIGNTLYRASSNTRNHYQDNRVEHWLEPVRANGDLTRIRRLVDAGVIGLMFGAGLDGMSTFADQAGDGAYEPAPVDNRAHSHVSWLNERPAETIACPSGSCKVDDDDGGLLRKGALALKASGSIRWYCPDRRACATRGDLDGNGTADLIWHNAAAGQTDGWLMSGLDGRKPVRLLNNLAWAPVARGDVDGNGTADLLWHNPSVGATDLWLMDGLGRTAVKRLLTNPPWRPVATGDFNGDGKDDIVWHNATIGRTTLWLMNGSTPTSVADVLTHPDWQVVATGDLNGDGKDDLVWHNAINGGTDAWLMNGTGYTGMRRLFTSTAWRPVAVGDLDGNGKGDIIWYSQAQSATDAWLMDGLNMTSRARLLTLAGWAPITARDFNGDGKDDLLWRNATTGQVDAWVMHGFAATSRGVLFKGTAWVPIGK